MYSTALYEAFLIIHLDFNSEMGEFDVPKAIIAHGAKRFFCHFEALSLTAHNLS